MKKTELENFLLQVPGHTDSSESEWLTAPAREELTRRRTRRWLDFVHTRPCWISAAACVFAALLVPLIILATREGETYYGDTKSYATSIESITAYGKLLGLDLFSLKELEPEVNVYAQAMFNNESELIALKENFIFTDEQNHESVELIAVFNEEEYHDYNKFSTFTVGIRVGGVQVEYTERYNTGRYSYKAEFYYETVRYVLIVETVRKNGLRDYLNYLLLGQELKLSDILISPAEPQPPVSDGIESDAPEQ